MVIFDSPERRGTSNLYTPLSKPAILSMNLFPTQKVLPPHLQGEPGLDSGSDYVGNFSNGIHLTE